MNMLFGCDPELFLTIGKDIVPCVGLLPGTKADPFPVPKSGVGLMVQEDGVTCEFNLAPCTANQFTTHVNQGMLELKKYVKSVIPTANVLITPSRTFTAKELDSEQAMTLGCDPDCIAWNRGDIRKPPGIKAIGLNRFAGGHLHFGYDKENCTVPPWALIQYIEVMGYGPLMYLDPQGARRKFYGQAGLYREKSYGVEYRTPSNFWVSNPTLVQGMFQAAQLVVDNQELARELYPQIDAASKQIKTAIATENWTDKLHYLSEGLLTQFNKAQPKVRLNDGFVANGVRLR